MKGKIDFLMQPKINLLQWPQFVKHFKRRNPIKKFIKQIRRTRHFGCENLLLIFHPDPILPTTSPHHFIPTRELKSCLGQDESGLHLWLIWKSASTAASKFNLQHPTFTWLMAPDNELERQIKIRLMNILPRCNSQTKCRRKVMALNIRLRYRIRRRNSTNFTSGTKDRW